jgi:hypothetical protein
MWHRIGAALSASHKNINNRRAYLIPALTVGLICPSNTKSAPYGGGATRHTIIGALPALRTVGNSATFFSTSPARRKRRQTRWKPGGKSTPRKPREDGLCPTLGSLPTCALCSTAHLAPRFWMPPCSSPPRVYALLSAARSNLSAPKAGRPRSSSKRRCR